MVAIRGGAIALAIGTILSGLPGLGCAPQIDGPVEHQRAIDREDGDRLAAQLAQLPGVVTASVILHHATRDPLAATISPATFTAVITVDDRTDRAAIQEAAARLARATLPELTSEPTRPTTGRLPATAVPRELPIVPARPLPARPEDYQQAPLWIEVNATVHRPVVGKVGPFTVEESSRTPLKATLAAGCLAIAGLAAALARRRYRLGNSAQ